MFSNGVGIVVLKRLDEALADGDCIHAVIKAAAVNNDGSLKAGYTAPSIEGQAKVIAAAQAMADVPAETITYVEAHGTATALGDPIEIAALTQAFRSGTGKEGLLRLGSVKANIGHADTAAGIAGLIKTVLMLKHRMIPPCLHFEAPNPEIDLANSPFFVNTRLSPWESGRPSPAGGRQLLRHRRHERPCHPRGSARAARLRARPGPGSWCCFPRRPTAALDARDRQPGAAPEGASLPGPCRCGLHPAEGAKGLRSPAHGRMRGRRRRGSALSKAWTGSGCSPRSRRLATREVVFLFSGQGSQYVDMGLRPVPDRTGVPGSRWTAARSS